LGTLMLDSLAALSVGLLLQAFSRYILPRLDRFCSGDSEDDASSTTTVSLECSHGHA
jgi:hypothetical protein